MAFLRIKKDITLQSPFNSEMQAASGFEAYIIILTNILLINSDGGSIQRHGVGVDNHLGHVEGEPMVLPFFLSRFRGCLQSKQCPGPFSDLEELISRFIDDTVVFDFSASRLALICLDRRGKDQGINVTLFGSINA